MSRRRGERGAALVVTLIFTTAMAAAAVAFLAGRQTDALALRGQLQAVEAQTMLDAALRQTVALVVNRKPRQRVPSDLSWPFGDVAVRVRIEAESGKVDLNKAEPSLLQGLALAVGLSDEEASAIADAIVDWRDENQLGRNNGAEDRDYGDDGQATSGAADRPFAHPAELRYVLNVDPPAAALLAPHVTVYSGQAQPEPRKASPLVRQALEIARGLPKDQDEADQTETKAATGDAKSEVTPEGAGTGGLGSRAAGRSAGAGGSAGDQTEPGRLSPSAGTASSLSKLERPSERRRGQDDQAGGGRAAAGEDDTAGAQTLFLDVSFPNGYQAAAKAVVAFGAAGGGQEPFVVLDWTPIVGARSGGT